MKDSVYGYHTSRIFVKDGVREPSCQNPTVLLMDDGLCLGHPENRGNTGIDTTEELLAQAGTPCFIPNACLSQVLFNLRRNDQFSGHSDGGPCV